MLNNNGKLEVFENFQIDRTLPKYSESEKVALTGSILVSNGTFGLTTGSSDWGIVPASPSQIRWNGVDGEFFDDKSKVKKSGWFARFRKKKEERLKTMTILNFFTSLAQSLNDIKVLQDTAIHYETTISNAAKAGQTALVEKFKTRLESAKSELQLVNVGLTKYLIEDQVIDFFKKTSRDKKLKLTWIKNFIKPIPSKILDVKVNLDKQLIFDNYLVMHYDPNDDATDLTELEKKERPNFIWCNK